MFTLAKFWKAALTSLAIVSCYQAISLRQSFAVEADDGGTAAVKATQPVPSNGVIPNERNFAWNPGLTSKGGVPNRTTLCATLTPGANIQAALDIYPAGQVVKLKADTFIVNNSLRL